MVERRRAAHFGAECQVAFEQRRQRRGERGRVDQGSDAAVVGEGARGGPWTHENPVVHGVPCVQRPPRLDGWFLGDAGE